MKLALETTATKLIFYCSETLIWTARLRSYTNLPSSA